MSPTFSVNTVKVTLALIVLSMMVFGYAILMEVNCVKSLTLLLL